MEKGREGRDSCSEVWGGGEEGEAAKKEVVTRMGLGGEGSRRWSSVENWEGREIGTRCAQDYRTAASSAEMQSNAHFYHAYAVEHFLIRRDSVWRYRLLIESHRQQVIMHRLAHYSMMTCFLRPKASHLQLPEKHWTEK